MEFRNPTEEMRVAVQGTSITFFPCKEIRIGNRCTVPEEWLFESKEEREQFVCFLAFLCEDTMSKQDMWRVGSSMGLSDRSLRRVSRLLGESTDPLICVD